MPETELWRRHKQGDRQATSELLDRLKPHVDSRVSLYRDVAIPPQAIYGHAMNLTMHAIDTYDPKSGAALPTHVVNHLQRVSRFVNQNKNIARIPEHRALRVGTFQSVHSSMSAELGRQPTVEELADELGWSHKEVGTMGRSLRSDLSASAMPEAAEARFHDRTKETMYFVRGGLLPQEREAFDHLWGFDGKKHLSVSEISKRTGLSVDRVYMLRKQTAQKIQRTM